MCVSSSASFVASAVLTTAGIIALKKTNTSSQILFASIPLLFAIQQFTEGFVWLSLTSSTLPNWHKIPVFLYLFFAMVIWPSMVPISVCLIEKNVIRKKILKVLSILGILLSIGLLVNLIFRDFSASILSFRIHYELNYFFELPFLEGIPYLLVILLPLLISSTKRMIYFGIAAVFSFIVTNIYFNENTVSVWCFFAAIISIVVVSVMWIINRNENQKAN